MIFSQTLIKDLLLNALTLTSQQNKYILIMNLIGLNIMNDDQQFFDIYLIVFSYLCCCVTSTSSYGGPPYLELVSYGMLALSLYRASSHRDVNYTNRSNTAVGDSPLDQGTELDQANEVKAYAQQSLEAPKQDRDEFNPVVPNRQIQQLRRRTTNARLFQGLAPNDGYQADEENEVLSRDAFVNA